MFQRGNTISHSYPILDRARALAHMSDDLSIYEEVTAEFRRTTSKLIADMQASAERGDVRETVRLSHSLKSASRTVGGMRLGAFAERVETQAASASASELLNGIEQIREEYAILLTALDAADASAAASGKE
jgi:HPt (histidine-containing phosphotransfer) domain-containing protein